MDISQMDKLLNHGLMLTHTQSTVFTITKDNGNQLGKEKAQLYK